MSKQREQGSVRKCYETMWKEVKGVCHVFFHVMLYGVCAEKHSLINFGYPL